MSNNDEIDIGDQSLAFPITNWELLAVPTLVAIVGGIITAISTFGGSMTVTNGSGAIALLLFLISLFGVFSLTIRATAAGRSSVTIGSLSELTTQGLRLLVAVTPVAAAMAVAYSFLIHPAIPGIDTALLEESGLPPFVEIPIVLLFIYIGYTVIFAVAGQTAINESVIAGYKPSALWNSLGNPGYLIMMVALPFLWIVITAKLLSGGGKFATISIPAIAVAFVVGGGVVALVAAVLFVWLLPFILAPVFLLVGLYCYVCMAAYLGFTYALVDDGDSTGVTETNSGIDQFHER